MPPRPPSLYALTVYALITGAVATSAGLVFAAYVPTPLGPERTWDAATGILVVLAGLLAVPVLGRFSRRPRTRSGRSTAFAPGPATGAARE